MEGGRGRTEDAHDVLAVVALALHVHLGALLAQDLLAVLPEEDVHVAQARERLRREEPNQLEERHRDVVPSGAEEDADVRGLVVDVLAARILIRSFQWNPQLHKLVCALTRGYRTSWKARCDRRRRELYSRMRTQLPSW